MSWIVRLYSCQKRTATFSQVAQNLKTERSFTKVTLKRNFSNYFPLEQSELSHDFTNINESECGEITKRMSTDFDDIDQNISMIQEFSIYDDKIMAQACKFDYCNIS